MVPPSGNTNERPQNPEPGTLRFNTDIGSLEYFKGDTLNWETISRNYNQWDGGHRGLYFNGSVPGTSEVNTIEYITISTLGDATNFGDSTIASRQGTAFSSITRAIRGGGVLAPGGHSDVLDYVTIASTGNAADFGDLTQQKIGYPAGFANQTRGICAGGEKSGPVANTDVIEYVTIASVGNAKDFGDLTYTAQGESGGASPTRGIVAGGFTPTVLNTINYFTMSTTGNAVDFGDLSQGRRGASRGQSNNSTRWIMIAGQTPTYVNTIDYITISTTGNAADFGDTSTVLATTGAMSSPTRCVFAGGSSSDPTYVNTIAYITFATLGDGVDFGDTSTATSGVSGCSNAHGGL
jgi:hypothetical protein